MSWDVSAYRFAEPPMHENADIGALECLALGRVAEVREMISNVLSDTEWEAYWTGFCPGEDCRLEFFVGDYKSDDDDLIDHLQIAVYGDSSAAIPLMLRLAERYRWTLQEHMDGLLILADNL